MNEPSDLRKFQVETLVRGGGVEITATRHEFRSLYEQLKEIQPSARWIVLLLGDQAVAQPIGNANAFIFIQDSPARYYSGADFEFTNSSTDSVIGSTAGRYRFGTFLGDVIGIVRLVVWAASAAGIAIVTYMYVPCVAEQKVGEALISALAILISVFVLLVLNPDPKRDYPYLANGRYRMLTSSDRYIALIALSALVSAIIHTGVIATRPMYRILQTIPFAVACLLTFASFWLVISYHFTRKAEMAEIEMAKLTLQHTQNTKA